MTDEQIIELVARLARYEKALREIIDSTEDPSSIAIAYLALEETE